MESTVHAMIRMMLFCILTSDNTKRSGYVHSIALYRGDLTKQREILNDDTIITSRDTRDI